MAGGAALNAQLDNHAAIIVDALDGLDTIVMVLGKPPPPSALPRVLAVNAAFTRRASSPHGVVAPCGLGSFTAPDSSPATLAAIGRAVADGTKLAGEVQLAGQSGPFWLGFSMTTIRTPTGATRCILIGKDITDQVRRSGEDRATQRLLASAFASVGAAVTIVTAGERMVTASQRFATISGCGPRDLVGKSLSGILDPETRRHIQAALSEAAMAAQAASVPASTQVAPAPPAPPPGALTRDFRGGGVRHDGTPFTADFTVAVIDGRAGEKLAVLTVHPDEAPETIGKIRLLGLAEVKAALGQRWLAVADRAMIIAETTIRRRLGQQDVLSRTSDQAFLIWFQQGTADDNALLAARIAREVRIVLLTEFADALVASVASATVPMAPGTVPGQVDSQLETAFDRHPGLKPDPPMEAARAYLAWAEKELPVETEQLYGRGGQSLPAVWCSLPAAVASRTQEAAILLSHETLGEFEQDILRLRVGLSLAAKAAARNQPRSCFISLSCECLSLPRSRAAAMELLASVDTATGNRLTLLLSGELAQFRPARLQDLVVPLRGKVRAVGLATQTILDLPVECIQRPFSIVSFHAGVLGGEGAETALWRAIDAVHRAGSKVVARHVGTPTEARKLLELGADYVCGTAPAAILG
jgi:PAS domain-containing protein